MWWDLRKQSSPVDQAYEEALIFFNPGLQIISDTVISLYAKLSEFRESWILWQWLDHDIHVCTFCSIPPINILYLQWCWYLLSPPMMSHLTPGKNYFLKAMAICHSPSVFYTMLPRSLSISTDCARVHTIVLLRALVAHKGSRYYVAWKFCTSYMSADLQFLWFQDDWNCCNIIFCSSHHTLTRKETLIFSTLITCWVTSHSTFWDISLNYHDSVIPYCPVVCLKYSYQSSGFFF